MYFYGCFMFKNILIIYLHYRLENVQNHDFGSVN